MLRHACSVLTHALTVLLAPYFLHAGTCDAGSRFTGSACPAPYIMACLWVLVTTLLLNVQVGCELLCLACCPPGQHASRHSQHVRGWRSSGLAAKLPTQRITPRPRGHERASNLATPLGVQRVPPGHDGEGTHDCC